jgi:hypothetical protein
MAWRKSKAPGCIKVTLKKYAERPGPPYHALDCAGLTKKGNDGADYVSKESSNGVYKWVKVGATRKAKGVKTYKIHDNGAEPFIVDDDGKNIVVFRQVFDMTANSYKLGKKIFESPYKKIYPGKDPLKISWGGSETGNTVLAQISANKFIFIGDNVYSFELVDGDEPVLYSSPVGNSDVPYPYLIGKKYTYLLLSQKTKAGPGKWKDQLPAYIPNEKLDPKIDAYAQFFGFEIAMHGEKKIKLDVPEEPIENFAKVLKRKTIAKRELYSRK